MTQQAGNQPLSQRIVKAVADAEGVDPTTIEPLATVVDPDALNRLFRPQCKAGAVPDATTEVTFNHCGYEVRATATGQVTLTEHG